MDLRIIEKLKWICEKQIGITTLLLANSEENVTSSYKTLNKMHVICLPVNHNTKYKKNWNKVWLFSGVI